MTFRKREQLTIKLPGELVDRLKAAAKSLSHPPTTCTVTSLIEAGARALVEKLEASRERDRSLARRVFSEATKK